MSSKLMPGLFLAFLFQITIPPIISGYHYSSTKRPSYSPTPPSYQYNVPLEKYPPPPISYSHPLDPLSESEITFATLLIRNDGTITNFIFKYMALKEPLKSLLLPHFLQNTPVPPNSIPRRAYAVLYDLDTQTVYEVTVNLSDGVVESFVPGKGDPSPISLNEQLIAESIIREDYRVQERCEELGWSDMDLVVFRTNGARLEPTKYEGRWIRELFAFGKNFPDDNHYAHPFDFVITVDLDEQRVISIDNIPTHDSYDNFNRSGNVVPTTESNFDPAVLGESFYDLRKHFKPVNVSQPYGVSFTVAGNSISWQKFRFRLSFSPREGPTIHQVAFNDAPDLRPLFYRLSLADTYVPYGDPRPPFNWRIAHNEGEDGIGLNMVELQPQVDCIGEAYFFDIVINDRFGSPKRVPNAICLFEEDVGILWKHTTVRTGRSPTVRSQRLTLMFIATYANFEYAYHWHFYLDGRIEFNVKLTGSVGSTLLAEGSTPFGFGSQVADRINAQYSQHFFTIRIDPEIAGNNNTVIMRDVVPLQAPSGSQLNPYGNGFGIKNTILKTTGQGRTNDNPLSSRVWLMGNKNQKNPFTGLSRGYALEPTNSPKLMRKVDSILHLSTAWLDYNFWVNLYADGQIYPGGFFLHGGGVEEHVTENPDLNVENQDIICWYSFAMNHIPKTEDWPIISGMETGIMLKPVNFFDANPALDVPPPVVARPWLDLY